MKRKGTQSYEKTLIDRKNIGKVVQRRYKTFDYTTITNRVKTVRWSDNRDPTDVVKVLP